MRLTSLLGMLRFWWRVRASRSTDDVRRKELKIFGGPATDDGGGTGCFTADISTLSAPTAFERSTLTSNQKLREFLGHGVTANRNGALPAGKLGVLTLRFRAKDKSCRQEVLQALNLLCAFGGIGLLSRRGMGSLCAFAPGTRSLVEAVNDAERLRSDIASSGSHHTRLVCLPVEVGSGIEALAIVAEMLSQLGLVNALGKPELLSNILSSQSDLAPHASALRRRDPNFSARRPSPLLLKVQSCVHEGKVVQLLTALLIQSSYLDETIPSAPMTLARRLEIVMDDLDRQAARAREKLFGERG